MDFGFAALLFGVTAMVVLALVPRDVMRAAGGLLILLTLALIGLQILGVA
jgi:hypothetical protein